MHRTVATLSKLVAQESSILKFGLTFTCYHIKMNEKDLICGQSCEFSTTVLTRASRSKFVTLETAAVALARAKYRANPLKPTVAYKHSGSELLPLGTD